MSDIVIKAENIGKSYIIGHEKRESYTALRDVIAHKAKRFINSSKQMISGKQLIAGNEMEEFWALRDLNFEIKQGDRVGIIGRNGAGKSTLLKVLSRITEPTTGRIQINGRVASLLEVGTGFHPELTGRENIYLNGAILGMSRAEIKSKFDEIVDFSGVEKFLDTPVKRYSSGMYVRLAFSVAAHLDPEILVVDEVLAVGDAEFQKKCLGKMEDASTKEGRTVLFVSHNMDLIYNLCSKAIYLNQGKIEMYDNCEITIKDYIKHKNESDAKQQVSNYHLKNEDLKLENFEISKSELDLYSNLNYSITINSKIKNKITGLALLIYNEWDERVAVIDLRTHEILEHAKSNTRYTINGEIKNINLLPGIYNIGLYIDSIIITKNFFNILSIIIKENYTDNEILPYPLKARGICSLEHSLKLN